MKKAQLMAQPFYYIFVIIVIALIFIFGFRIINNLINLQEQSKFVQFKLDLENNVKYVYTLNPSSRVTYNLILPKDVNEVCFKNFQEYSKVYSASRNFQNFDVNNLIPIQDDYCIKTKDQKLSFTLENKIIDNKTRIIIE